MRVDEAICVLDQEHPMPVENEGPLFSRRLRRLMDAKGLTQEQLAKGVGCSHSAVGYWVRGKRTPPIATAVRIAKLLNVSTDYLCGADGETEEDQRPLGATKDVLAWATIKETLDRYMKLGTVEELEEALYNATL